MSLGFFGDCIEMVSVMNLGFGSDRPGPEFPHFPAKGPGAGKEI